MWQPWDRLTYKYVAHAVGQETDLAFYKDQYRRQDQAYGAPLVTKTILILTLTLIKCILFWLNRSDYCVQVISVYNNDSSNQFCMGNR